MSGLISKSIKVQSLCQTETPGLHITRYELFMYANEELQHAYTKLSPTTHSFTIKHTSVFLFIYNSLFFTNVDVNSSCFDIAVLKSSEPIEMLVIMSFVKWQMISAHHEISVSGGCDHFTLCVYASPATTNDPGAKTHRSLMLLIKNDTHLWLWLSLHKSIWSTSDHTSVPCVWVLLTAIHHQNRRQTRREHLNLTKH